MESAPAIDITPAARRVVLDLIAKHLPNTEVWPYGSRVRGTSTPKSDLDLVALAEPDSVAAVAELREAFEESFLPFRVDLWVWKEIPASFRQQVAMRHAVLAHGDESNERETQSTADAD